MLRRKLFLLLRAGFLLTLSAAVVGSGSRHGIPKPAASVAGVCSAPDPHFATTQPGWFAWKLFLAINCPAQSGTTAPLVWETWKPVGAVYLPGDQKPPDWSAPLPSRRLLYRQEIDSYTLLDKAGQPVLNEIRMNRCTFEYIVAKHLYSIAGQLQFFNSPGAQINFPPGSIEIKAAWLILNPNDPRNSTYYSIRSSVVDPSGATHEVLAGLAGLHITSKVLPNWFWTTFEHIDNQERTGVPEMTPVPPNVLAANNAAHAALPPQSVWRFYNLRGVQLDYTDSAGHPTLLSNTLLETRFQLSSSCITCHNLATRGSLDQGRLWLWNNTPQGVRGYIGKVNDASNRYFDKGDHRVCYDDRNRVFTDCNPSHPKAVYKTMDFVWSLREAQ